MKVFALLGMLFIAFLGGAQVDRKAAFHALSSSSKDAVSKQLNALGNMKESADVRAFKGALMMKHAQFLGAAKDKLEEFKQGKLLLDTEIKEHHSNVEYRFLRLLIQENAPKILKYNTHIQGDSNAIKEGYSKLKEPITKEAIKSYAPQSKYLQDLK